MSEIRVVGNNIELDGYVVAVLTEDAPFSVKERFVNTVDGAYESDVGRDERRRNRQRRGLS